MTSPFTDWQREVLGTLMPPPNILTSEWAEAERGLPTGLTSRSGKWRNETTPYGVGIMDALDDPETEYVIVMKSSQVGATEFALNAKGKRIENDPCPMMFVRPTIMSAQEYSKTRFNPLVDYSPAIKKLIKAPRTRNSENSILFKMFPGGFVHFGGANSPASLKSRAAKFIVFDEIDEYDLDVKAQGDVIEMVIRRAETFPDRTFMLISTPTVKHLSRIEAAFNESNQQRFQVPCPKCRKFQTLTWSGVKWDNTRDTVLKRAETALYECKFCTHLLTDADRYKAVKAGKWIAEVPEVRNIQGFHLNFLYSPFIQLKSKVETFLKVKKIPERLKVFVNQDLGETFEEIGEKANSDALFARREKYKAEVPAGAVVLTAFVDQQKDRLEILVCGWGDDQQSWIVEHKIIYGNVALVSVWTDLDNYLKNVTFRHESGSVLKIAICGIDSGDGEFTKVVYEFCKGKDTRRVYATKGANVEAAPLVNMPRKQKGKALLFMIGVHTAKTSLMARLKLEEFGPGYIHIPQTVDEEFCKQMTAEELRTKFVRGYTKRVWHKTRERNEALDLMVGNIAVHAILNPDIEAIRQVITRKKTAKGQDYLPKKPKKSWAKRWKV